MRVSEIFIREIKLLHTLKRIISPQIVPIAIWGFFLCVIAFIGCEEETVEKSVPDHTVIVYMIADNNLGYFAKGDKTNMYLAVDSSGQAQIK